MSHQSNRSGRQRDRRLSPNQRKADESKSRSASPEFVEVVRRKKGKNKAAHQPEGRQQPKGGSHKGHSKSKKGQQQHSSPKHRRKDRHSDKKRGSKPRNDNSHHNAHHDHAGHEHNVMQKKKSAPNSWAAIVGHGKEENKPPTNNSNKSLPDPPVDPRDKDLYSQLKEFALNPKHKELLFSGISDSSHRRRIHILAGKFCFGHKSFVPADQAKEKRPVKSIRVYKKISGPLLIEVTSSEIPPVPKSLPSSDLKFYNEILAFMKSKERTKDFPSSLTSEQRSVIHDLAELFSIDHESFGRRNQDRFIRISKVDPEEQARRLRWAAALQSALDQHREEVLEEQSAFSEQSIAEEEEALEQEKQQPVVPHNLRYMSWNIEWMNHFYESDTKFADSAKMHGISDTKNLMKRIAGVILENDPDAVAIVEGPANIARMRLFVTKYLKNSYEVFGGLNKSDQQLFILTKRGGRLKNPRMHAAIEEYLQQEWQFDIDGDFHLDNYEYLRRPLVVEAETTVITKDPETGRNVEETKPIFFTAMHAKSKYIGGGKRMWNGDADSKQQFIKKAVKNRRRITAECMRLRRCLNEYIFKAQTDPLVIVSGDINDGPGLDFFEQFYVLGDCVDALLGTPFKRNKVLNAVLIRTKLVPLSQQWTCIFDDYIDGIKGKKCMLDHVFVSDALWHVITGARVCHREFDAACIGRASDRQERPSDHRPVITDFAL